jgi:predicted Zn-dependent protease
MLWACWLKRTVAVTSIKNVEMTMKRLRCLLVMTAFTFGALDPLPCAAKDKKKDPEEIGNRDVGKGVNFYSLEKEIALGKQLAQEVEREAKLIDHPIPAEFVNRLAQNIVRNSDVKFPVTAKVIDSNQINAFALPGGFLFVNSGLILKAETEAELASAMSHEIAHVAARHGTRQASRGQIVNIASIPLIFMGGWAGYAVRQGAGLMIPMTFLKFSRGFEEEADLLGLQYLYKSGYDPTAFVDFFERLEAMERKKPGTVSEIFRSHPNVSSRIKSTQKNIQQLLKEKPEYVISTSEFAEVRRNLEQSLNRRKAEPAKTGPTLRRTPSGKEPIENRDSQKPDDADERPTLKRRHAE